MRINELKAITDIMKWITGLYNDKIDHISANITDSTHVKVIFERNIIEDNDDFFIALLDLNLPDAPDGEIVDYVLSKNIVFLQYLLTIGLLIYYN